MTDSALLSFYRGIGTDHAGRRIDDILCWDHRRLEMVHDYIQWLFPLPEPSRFNTQAPLLTPKDINTFRASPDLLAKVRQALGVMLAFFGLGQDASGIRCIPTQSSPTQSIPEASGRDLHWLQPLNHNHLRLTRILMFLTYVGLKDEARQLLSCLEDIAAHDAQSAIAPRTLTFWRNAVATSS
jgi:hypothetical protein